MKGYSRFLAFLEQCGGCIGPRTFKKCPFAHVCVVVEKIAEKGAINNSKDLFCRSAPPEHGLAVFYTGKGNHPRIVADPSPGIPEDWPRRGSYRDYKKEFEQG